MTDEYEPRTAAQTAELDQGRAAIDQSIDDLVEGARLLLTEMDPNDVLLSVFDVTGSDPAMSCWVAAGAILRLARR